MRDEEWPNQWVHMKDVAIGNDVITFFDVNKKTLPEDADPSLYAGHPRNARSYSYAFRLAREQSIPLMDTVHNAAYTPAKYLSRLGLKAMQERGRMQEWMIADITIFDPEEIHDNANMMLGNRAAPPSGIPHVLVSGQFVVRDGKSRIGARPGQPIRYEPITDSEIELDYDDKKYQWHADLPDYQDLMRD